MHIFLRRLVRTSPRRHPPLCESWGARISNSLPHYLELHFHRLGRGRIRGGEFEEVHRIEAEGRGNEIAGKSLLRSVERHYRRVVEAARGLDLVLGVAKLLLQLQEVLVRLEVRVRFRNGKERLQAPVSMFSACAFSTVLPAPIAAARALVTFSNALDSCAA